MKNEVTRKVLENAIRYQKPMPSDKSKPNIEVVDVNGTVDVYTSNGKEWIGFRRKGLGRQ